ncbi:MAG: pantoate--beta-alanine ligase [Verrucomicrobia bacterium TMED44]|nr:MAG: pantoate--beta-alanine ligase [Verrucomicrobia bacterium TMED44]
MEVITSIEEIQQLAHRLEKEGKKIGFVPTMGYLHNGHLSLIDLIRERSDILILSIFVNPTQFGVGEDLEKYPRDMERDLELCREKKVDYIFAPQTDDIYLQGASTYVSEEGVSQGLCGEARPTHFKGVTTICAKLFNLVRPAHIAVGQKDAQQVVVLKRMIRDLHFPIEVVIGPTLREPDGLAMSSRNSYLNDRQRQDALLIHKALQAGKLLVDEKGVRNVDRVKAELMTVLRSGSFVRINYAEVVDRENMKAEKEIELGRSMLVIAVWVDNIRLIDNILLG